MVVEEMNILTTIFLKFDNHKVIIPNSVLATKAIFNYYRSPDMSDIIEFYVHICTPVEKISLIKHRINRYVLKNVCLFCLVVSFLLSECLKVETTYGHNAVSVKTRRSTGILHLS